MDVEQLKEGVRAGLVSVDRLNDLIDTSERELEAAKHKVAQTEQEIDEAKRRIAELERNWVDCRKEKVSEPFEEQEYEEEPPPSKKKVGRNDPCPCGSGRKLSNAA